MSIPNIWITRAEHPAGKCVLIALGSAGLFLGDVDHWKYASSVLALVCFAPKWRKKILGLAALVSIPLLGNRASIYLSRAAGHAQVSGWLSSDLFFGIIAAGTIIAASKFSDWARSHKLNPIWPPLGFYLVIRIFESLLPMGSVVLYLMLVLSYFVATYSFTWIMDISSQRSDREKGILQSLGWYNPLWLTSSFIVPLTGHHYWEQEDQAARSDQVALARIKGLKLLYWGVVLTFVRDLIEAIAYGGSRWPILYDLRTPFGYVPPIAHALSMIRYTEFSVIQAWSIVLIDFAMLTVTFVASGHVAVGVYRMLGFDLPRNTQHLFKTRSVADFFQRYYHFYKEFILKYFFYPAFFLGPRAYPRLRIFLATLLSVGVVNGLVGFFLDYSPSGIEYSLLNELNSNKSHLIYCLLMSAGIAASLILNLDRTPEPISGLRRLWILLRVFMFFAVIRVFDLSIMDSALHNWALFMNLFGIRFYGN